MRFGGANWDANTTRYGRCFDLARMNLSLPKLLIIYYYVTSEDVLRCKS